MAVTREDYVAQSVQTYVRRRLFDSVPNGGQGYPEDAVEFLESFDDNMFGAQEEPRKNYIASGFDFDDDGHQAELGSDLIRRVYTFEFFVVGTSSVWAKNLAQAVKFAVEYDGVIPLLDIMDTGAAPNWPQIDSLVLVGATANRVLVQDPAPWQRHVWVARVQVEDSYQARLT